MELRTIHLECVKTGSLSSDSADGICHVKTLPYLSVVQAVVGNYDIRLGSGKTENTGNRGFFIAPADIQQTITHRADPASGHMECRWVFLKITLNDHIAFESLYDLPVILPETESSTMHKLFDRLFLTNDAFERYACCYEIAAILSRVSRKKEKPTASILDATISYIKQHYKEKLSIDTLAATANLSPSHLFSVFKKETGTTPITYINRYRLSLAEEMLLNTDMRISEISSLVGISDQVYFNKLFRKAYQMSPLRFRQIYKNSRG